MLGFVILSHNQYHSGSEVQSWTCGDQADEMISSALESFAFWTGIVAVGITAAGALLGCLSWWFSTRINSVKEGMISAEETTSQALAEAISHLPWSANWTGKMAVIFTAAGALFGCLSWWFSSAVSEMEKEARVRFETEHAAKMKVAENELSKARQETARARADAAAADERGARLEAEAAGLRGRAARAEYMIKAAEAQSREAKKETARAGEETAKALAETAATKERASKIEIEAAGLRERAARAENELMKVKERIKRRRITDVQRTRLLQELKPIPRGPIKIIAVMGDEEAGRLARRIADVLKEAGWDDIHVSRGIFRGSIDGFEIRIRDREKVPVFALQIAKAFDSIGLEATLVLDPSVSEGAMEIIIGMKPDSE